MARRPPPPSPPPTQLQECLRRRLKARDRELQVRLRKAERMHAAAAARLSRGGSKRGGGRRGGRRGRARGSEDDGWVEEEVRGGEREGGVWGLGREGGREWEEKREREREAVGGLSWARIPGALSYSCRLILNA